MFAEGRQHQALPPISGALLEVSSSLYSLGSLQWGFILGHLMGPTSSQGHTPCGDLLQGPRDTLSP